MKMLVTNNTGPSGNCGANDWWDALWTSRYNLMTSNSGAAVASSYTVAFTFNHSALVSAGTSLADGKDIRIVYWNGMVNTEIDRIIAPDSSWNNASTKILFPLVNGLAAGNNDTGYSVYYNNPGAGAAPENISNVISYEAGWTEQTENNNQTLASIRNQNSYYSLQLRQLDTQSNNYEIYVYDKTNDSTAMCRLIITDNVSSAVLFDVTYGSYGTFASPGMFTQTISIASTDFEVSIETGEYSYSRQYFGNELFTYQGTGNGGNLTDTTVRNYTRLPPLVSQVTSSLDCSE